MLEPVDVVEADHDGWLADERNCRAFLSLMARFASLRVPTDYVALIGRDMAYRKGYTRSWNTWLPWSVHILGRVWEHALRNELGRELKAWCGKNDSVRSRLQESARAMLDMTGRIPRGVIHGEWHVRDEVRAGRGPCGVLPERAESIRGKRAELVHVPS